MNDFVITYGPQPRVWCPACHNDTPLATGIAGTLRPGDVDDVQRSHVCHPPESPWNQRPETTGYNQPRICGPPAGPGNSETEGRVS
jgi:hypothetical protein